MPNPLDLAQARRACVLLIDGMGRELLQGSRDSAPVIGRALADARELTAGFPTTTATSLGTLGTGVAPGQHGLLGYQVAVPGDGRLLNLLRWDQPVAPEQWQPVPTLFERAASSGVAVTHVSSEKFRNGGLTRAALRGGSFAPAEDSTARADRAVELLSDSQPALVYVYYGGVDEAGHIEGYQSDIQLEQLGLADRMVERIAENLPADAVLYVTADHGMVDIPEDRRMDADELALLNRGVALLGGEARARHVYAQPGAVSDVLQTWRELLGDRAWVLSRQEAIEAGWFGPVEDWAEPRIGDVVAACRDKWAVIASIREPLESSLRAMHGSLTGAELVVPLLEYRP
jgi:Type I phosphodiesterase / nucleotide pyrophosphatase